MMKKIFSPALQKGFTLIEMAIVVLVFGLITGAIFNYLAVSMDKEQRKVTIERQKKIAVALSNYAQINNTLPCPGDPSPTAPEYLGDQRAACGTDALRVGIVPYRALGLTQEDATDGYDVPFTYGVSAQVVAPANNVHLYCRQINSWISGVSNINSGKARFCCQRVPDFPDAGGAIVVRDSAAGAAVIVTQGTNPIAGEFTTDNVASTATATLTNTGYFAYVLVSHGKNGLGGQIFGRSNLRATANASADEIENADQVSAADRIFVDRSFASDFDDIVLWRTQEQVMAETANNSCSRP